MRDVPGEQAARVIIAPAGVVGAAIDVVRLSGPMPRPIGRSEQQRAQLAPVEAELRRHGYATEAGWVFGVDVRGAYASVRVRWTGRTAGADTPDTRETRNTVNAHRS